MKYNNTSGGGVFRRSEQGKWVLSEYNLDERLRLESVDVEIAMSTTGYTYAHFYRQVQFETEATENEFRAEVIPE